jgi:hypothetical protein
MLRAEVSAVPSPKEIAMNQSTCRIHPFEVILPRLTAVLTRCSPRRDPAFREEWLAEGIALAYQIWLSAQRRRRKFSLCSLARFASLSVGSGRKLAGYKSSDVLSSGSDRRGNHRIHSLEEHRPVRTSQKGRPDRLSDVLADSREDSPLENARRDLDYPAILDRESVSPKGRRVFAFLAENHGAGSQKELARELKISPTRVCQIKQQLAGCLAKHGYGPNTEPTN